MVPAYAVCDFTMNSQPAGCRLRIQCKITHSNVITDACFCVIYMRGDWCPDGGWTRGSVFLAGCITIWQQLTREVPKFSGVFFHYTSDRYNIIWKPMRFFRHLPLSKLHERVLNRAILNSHGLLKKMDILDIVWVYMSNLSWHQSMVFAIYKAETIFIHCHKLFSDLDSVQRFSYFWFFDNQSKTASWATLSTVWSFSSAVRFFFICTCIWFITITTLIIQWRGINFTYSLVYWWWSISA